MLSSKSAQLSSSRPRLVPRMGSRTSNAKRPAPTKAKRPAPKAEVVLIPGIPQDAIPVPPQDIVHVPLQDTIPTIPHDIIHEILDHLASDSDLRSLRACSLVSKPWVQPCQRHLFHTVVITPANARKWLKSFPAQDESPAYHVKDLRLEIGQVSRIPEEFFERIPWFTDVDRMSFLGYGGVPLGFGRFSPLWEPSFWKLPKSVTSLTIKTGAVTLVQVRDIIAQLSNLDDLELSGFAGEDRRKFPGIGAVLKGKFSGRLMLGDACADDSIINMLLEIPSGMRFTKLEFDCTRNLLPSSAIRLAEACAKTLLKLSHTVGLYCKSYRFPSPAGSSAQYRR